MESIDALRYAVNALDLQGGIAPGETAAHLLRLALCRMERDHYEHELEILRADWHALIEQHQIAECRLIDAQNKIAALEAELARATEQWQLEQSLAENFRQRARVGCQWSARWKKIAKINYRDAARASAAVITRQRDELDAVRTDLARAREEIRNAAAAPASRDEQIAALEDEFTKLRTSAPSAGPRLFTCDDCGATFASPQGLGSHRRKHTARPVEEPEEILPFEPEPRAPRSFIDDEITTVVARASITAGEWSCPSCGRDSFAQAINSSECIRCAKARKAA